MSYTNLLIQICTIWRFTEGLPDDYGNPTLTWNPLPPDQPCRLVTSSGREIKVGAELVIADYKLFLGNVDITEQDKVVIGTDTYEILLVQTFADDAVDHHKECLLRISR